MNIPFIKSHGTGNDFILIDNRDKKLPLHAPEKYEKLCDRHYGIGADGLILIQQHDAYEFEMVYYNSDGKIGSMCGNGGRCALAFTRELGIWTGDTVSFLAPDGPHIGALEADGEYRIQMKDVTEISRIDGGYFLDTGSPHFILQVEDLDRFDVFQQGKAIRNNARFREKGTNVNFIQPLGENHVKVRTYERGVENETQSCGTGVTAVAISLSWKKQAVGQQHWIVETLGGKLEVRCIAESSGHFHDVWLKGPVEKVFQGSVTF